MVCSAKDGSARKTKGSGMHSVISQDKKSISTQHAKSCFPSYTTETYFSELLVVLLFGSLTCKKGAGENSFEKYYFSWDKTTSIKTASCHYQAWGFNFTLQRTGQKGKYRNTLI